MSNRSWFLLATVAVLGTLSLGYMAIAYANSIDPWKDGGLLALITTITGAAIRFAPDKE